MKLYTEEQVRSILRVCLFSDLYDHITLNDILKTQTPIELPSDEEINEKGFGFGMHNFYKLGFREGAKWMRDKIQGGNNEQ